jgi:16S rRNA (cytidine1402-2'-O)-methyltransferase
VGLAVCATPIGNLGDITLRALDALRAADLIACEDTRRTGVLCAHFDVSARLVSLHEHNEVQRVPELLEALAAQRRVVLCSDAGMPAVSDPGARLVAAAAAAGFDVTVLPGASAVTAAIALAGFGGAGFTFCGFLPRTDMQRRAALERADAAELPVVAFDSPRRLPATLRGLAAAQPDRRAVVCRELTKLHEQVVRGSLRELADAISAPPPGEVTLVLDAVAPVPPAVEAAALAELADALGVRRAAELGARLTGAARNDLYRRLTARDR